MMLVPRKRNEFDLFDDVFSDSFFSRGHDKLMRTDIKEKGEHYLVDIDLPGYDKENIKIEIQDGYLTVSATMDRQKEDTEKDGKLVHKERYVGECSRSFYVGDNIKEEDIKAKYKNGTLTLTFPKIKKKEIERKQIIQIED